MVNLSRLFYYNYSRFRANPRSLATTCGISIDFFSYGYLDVSVPRVRLPIGILCLQHSGLPHSDICGSLCMCHSPQLIAAYHVLLRLSKPRHPPYALSNFCLTAALVFSVIVFVIYFISKLVFLVCITSSMSMNSSPPKSPKEGLFFLNLIRMPFYSPLGSPDSYREGGACGEYRIRTDDPLRARQVL